MRLQMLIEANGANKPHSLYTFYIPYSALLSCPPTFLSHWAVNLLSVQPSCVLLCSVVAPLAKWLAINFRCTCCHVLQFFKESSSVQFVCVLQPCVAGIVILWPLSLKRSKCAAARRHSGNFINCPCLSSSSSSPFPLCLWII